MRQLAVNPTKRTHMAVNPNGKPAPHSIIGLPKRFRAHTRLRLRLESGRTHQIRVHMAHLGYPLVGDPPIWWASAATEAGVRTVHANYPWVLTAKRCMQFVLALVHPPHGEMMEWTGTDS